MSHWLGRLQSRTAFALTAAGVAVACAYGIYQSPETWYIPVFCSLAIAFLVFAPRVRNLTFPDEHLCLKADTACSLLDRAVSSRVHPLCVHLAAKQACATAVAALAAKDVADNLRYLHNQLDSLSGEMLHETLFTRPTLKRHFSHTRSVEGYLCSLRRGSCAKCFAELPHGPEVSDGLRGVEALLHQGAVEPMENLIQAMDSTARGAAYATEMKALITRDMPDALAGMLRQVAALRERALRTVADLERDWDCAILATWTNELCRPARLRFRSVPRSVSAPGLGPEVAPESAVGPTANGAR